MKVLEREVVREREVRVAVPERVVEAAPRPTMRSVTVRRKRSNSLVRFAGSALIFSTVAGVACLMTNLWGEVSLERARQETRRNEMRAKVARQEAKAARDRIEKLIDPRQLRDWGLARGFIMDDVAPLTDISAGGTRVAQR